MLVRSSSEVAVSHYSDWSMMNWVLGYSALALAVLIVPLAVALWVFAIHLGPISAHAGSAVAGILAAVIQAVALWQIARHIEQFRWSVVLVLVVVAATAVLGRQAARSTALKVAGFDDYDYNLLGSRPARWTPAVVSVVIGLGVLIGDGVTRAAASIPMAVGMFVLVVLAFFGWLYLQAQTSN